MVSSLGRGVGLPSPRVLGTGYRRCCLALLQVSRLANGNLAVLWPCSSPSAKVAQSVAAFLGAPSGSWHETEDAKLPKLLCEISPTPLVDQALWGLLGYLLEMLLSLD